MKKYSYYIDKQTDQGTEFYLFADDFIQMISKSLTEQSKTILKDCINTQKPYEIYKNTMQIECENVKP